MKQISKLFLLMLLLTGSVFAQHTINVKFWVQQPGLPFNYSSSELETQVVEGQTFEIPIHTLPSNIALYQTLYDVLAGATFEVEDGALNEDITMDIFIQNFDPNNALYNALSGEDLFMYINIEVTAGGQLVDPYYFNDGKHLIFKLNKSTELQALLTLIGLWTGNFNEIAFAYFTNGSFTNDGITTEFTNDHVIFKAIHMSKFGGGRNGIGATNPVTPEELDGVPTEFRLDQNYPNPFNPTTKINYSVPDAGNVTLKVYNMLGAEVAELISSYQDAGNYSVSFDGMNLSSGIYLYELRLGNKSLSKKMMLLK